MPDTDLSAGPCLTRAEALDIVDDLITSHYGVSHLRFELHGTNTATTVVSVHTIGAPGVRRRKGTLEQVVLAHRLPARSLWGDILTVLSANLALPTGCTATAGCDIAADGTISRRYGGARERSGRGLGNAHQS